MAKHKLEFEFVSPQEHEAALTRLKALEDNYARLTKGVDTLTKNLEGRATSNDLRIILEAIQSDRQLTDVRFRMLGQAGAQGSSPKPSALDKLQEQITELSQRLAAALAIAGEVTKIKRTQEHQAGRLDDLSGRLSATAASTTEAISKANAASDAAGEALGRADEAHSLASTAMTTLNEWVPWFRNTLDINEEGRSTRLDNLDRGQADLNQRVEALERKSNFPLGLIAALFIVGGIIGWLLGLIIGPWVVSMIIGAIVGGVVGFAVTVFRTRPRKARPRKTTAQVPGTNSNK